MPLRKKIAIVILCVILLACLLVCGYFGAKTLRRSQQRQAAMAAYENKDYATAERLLRAYVQKDRNSEPEFVALANIYREFGNAGMEAQMWQSASALNPLNDEYRVNMLTSAEKSASYDLLHGVLGRMARMNEHFSDQELYLYVIASYRTNYMKEGDDAYKKAVSADPDAFQKSDLGRMAEFMVKYSSLSEKERDEYLDCAMESKDPMVQFEAVYTAMTRAARSGEEDSDAKVEELLKKLMSVNYFAGTPILADFYFSKFRFSDVITVAEPYLKTIDNLNLCILFAESCVFDGRPEKIEELAKRLRKKTGSISLIADYCAILTAYLENDREKLASNVRKNGKLVSSPLSRFIRLRVAMEQDSFYEILFVAEEFFANPPFHDLYDRAVVVCLDYLTEQMKKPENRDDPSQMAELAKILAGVVRDNRLLTDIVLFDKYKRNLAKEADLLAALEQFPDDLLLIQITAEFLIFNEKADQAMLIIEPALDSAPDDRKLNFLHMLALDQTGRHDEAAEVFRKLVEQSEFDIDMLNRYFKFCREHKRAADLSAMADNLENASDEQLKAFAPFFRADALLLEDDEAKEQEALKILAATPNDNPDFTFYAANKLSEADMLDEAEAKYTAILKTYSKPVLILVNLSEVYKAKNEADKAIETAKNAYSIEKKSILPAFVYAKRLSEAEQYEEAVEILKFPHHEVKYRADVVELWVSCMKQVIGKSIREQRFRQAEEQCKHLLIIAPDDADGRESMEKIREALSPENKDSASGNGVSAA